MDRELATFSIVAADLAAGEWGVAVQSRFLAAGAVVPWARAGVGAVATQAWARVTFGPGGLELLARGLDAEAVVERLLDGDNGREWRQLAVVDRSGRAHAFTGRCCLPWAGHLTGDGFACQGNILAGEDTITAMRDAYLGTAGQVLADRLLAALEAGQTAGGDRRGQQSAALYVAKPGGAYDGAHDRYLDLRVDDHPAPIAELGRLLDLNKLTFFKPYAPARVGLDSEVITRIQLCLQMLGFQRVEPTGEFDDVTRTALDAYLEGKPALDGGAIHGAVLQALQEAALARRLKA